MMIVKYSVLITAPSVSVEVGAARTEMKLVSQQSGASLLRSRAVMTLNICFT